MKKAYAAAVCIVAIAAAFTWVLLSDDRRAEPPRSSSTAPERQTTGPAPAWPETAVDELSRPAANETRASADQRLSLPPEEPVTATEPPADPWTARGIVLDPGGAPATGAEIVRSGTDVVLAVSGGDGRFEVTLEDSSALLGARREGLRTVFAGAVNRHLANEDAVIMVAPVVSLAGVVVSPDNAPVTGATMSMALPWEGLAGFPRSLERSSGMELNWKAAPDGTFEFDDVPIIGEISLDTSADGYTPTLTKVPRTSDFSLVIELKPKAIADAVRGSSDSVFFGVVRDAEGRPIEGVEVFLGDPRATSDSSGRWEFVRGQRVAAGTPLAAVHPSAGTALLPFEDAWNEKAARVGPLDLQLKPKSLSLQGHVLDSEGNPLQGWTVEVLNPTVLSYRETPSPTLESGGSNRSVSDRTEEAGGFKIEGLLDRSYDLRAYSGRSFLSITRLDVPAGTIDLELRLPPDAVVDELRVRVRTREGQPVSGASVAARFILERSRNGFTSQNGVTGITNEEGMALLSGVPRRGVDLVVSRPGIVTATLDPGEAGFPDDELQIEVYRNLDVVVDCTKLDPVPTRVRILDGNGKRLMIASRTSSGSSSSTDLRLEDGLSPVVSVSEAASELVIVRGSEESERFPIQLAPDTINRVEVP